MGDNFAKDKKANLSKSFDVLYHILEDNVFNSYIINLFNSSNKYVCIYSSNIEKPWAKHDLIENLLIGLSNIFQMNGN